MGWFWADTAPAAPSPHTLLRGNTGPLSECPMKNKIGPDTVENTLQGACPYVPPKASSDAFDSASTAAPPRSGLLSRLNPLNNMPFDLSNTRAEKQTQSLPLDRERSTIPKGDGSLWEYPSPQQMYNAMLRKGYTDTPVDAVESMVGVHNFLNEGAWAEIMGWERRFSQGIVQGWRICSQGEERANALLGTAEDPFDTTTWNQANLSPPKLLRFTGRPTEPTPKSRLLQALGEVWPETFGNSPPFDRHDWFVQRCDEKGCKEVRYVIDYYEGQPEPTGEPVFYLDVRPAVDGPRGATERIVRWGTDVWWRAIGGEERELRKAETAKKAEEKRMQKEKQTEKSGRYYGA